MPSGEPCFKLEISITQWKLCGLAGAAPLCSAARVHRALAMRHWHAVATNCQSRLLICWLVCMPWTAHWWSSERRRFRRSIKYWNVNLGSFFFQQGGTAVFQQQYSFLQRRGHPYFAFEQIFVLVEEINEFCRYLHSKFSTLQMKKSSFLALGYSIASRWGFYRNHWLWGQPDVCSILQVSSHDF